METTICVKLHDQTEAGMRRAPIEGPRENNWLDAQAREEARAAVKAQLLDQFALVHELDRNGNIASASDEFCRATGYCERELIEGGHALLAGEAKPGQPWLERHQVDVGTGKRHGSTLLIRRDGTDLWLQSAMTEIRNADGELSGHLVASIDITESRKLQEQFDRSGKLMQLGQLTATVAHEIRNPLGAIRTANFVLQRRLGGHVDGVQPQIDRINASIARCDKIITELLDFSRRKEPNTSAVAVDAWLGALVNDEATNLSGTPAIETDFGAGEIEAVFDRDQMRQVVVNLLSNAAEAISEKTKSGKPEGFVPTIRISSRHRDGRIYIDVCDNGMGIEPKNLLRIREPLFTTKSFGVGLGIPAIMRILENHGGQLGIASTFGEGTTMTAEFKA